MAGSAVLQNQLAHSGTNFPISTVTQQLFDTPHVLVPLQNTKTTAAWDTLVIVCVQDHTLMLVMQWKYWYETDTYAIK